MAEPSYQNILSTPLSISAHRKPSEKATDAAQAIIAAVALVLFSPLLLVIAALVKFTSPGPVLYRGARVGQGGKVFTIHKFRTLLVGAEQRIGARLLDEKDTCYTPLGRILKKTKLDELPQLWNVLTGDMRFVGPRPVRPIFLNRFLTEIPRYQERFHIKPGMTGLAQVRGGYETRPRHKLRYELLYIRDRSWWLDLQILFFTLLKIFHRWLSLGFLLFVLFVFVSFIPASVLSTFYLSLWGVRFNIVHALLIVAGAWLLGRQLPRHRLSLYRSPVYLPMGLFFVCSLVAIFFSIDWAQAVRGAAYHAVTGFFIALGVINSNLTRRFVRQAMGVVAAAAVVVSAIGLLKLVLLDYFTFAQAAFAAEAALFTHSPGITATLGSPPILAAYLTLAVPSLLFRLAQTPVGRDERDFWIIGATLTFIGIILTKTLFGLCALVLTVALYMGKYARPRNLLLCMTALVPFLVLSLLQTGPSLEMLWTRALEIGQDLGTSSSLVHLLFGYGPRTLVKAVQVSSVLNEPPDSAYLTLLLENGLLGMMMMMWVVMAALVAIFRAHHEVADEETRRILWAAFCSIVGFLVSLIGCNVFSSLTLQVLFWGTIGMGLGTVTHLSGKRKEFLLDWKLGH